MSIGVGNLYTRAKVIPTRLHAEHLAQILRWTSSANEMKTSWRPNPEAYPHTSQVVQSAQIRASTAASDTSPLHERNADHTPWVYVLPAGYYEIPVVWSPCYEYKGFVGFARIYSAKQTFSYGLVLQ